MKVYPQNVIKFRDNMLSEEENKKKFVEFVMKKMKQKVNY